LTDIDGFCFRTCVLPVGFSQILFLHDIEAITTLWGFVHKIIKL
jgi:hypothetical protein